jgi:predicted AAA+ superfamily ATPase
MKRILQDELDKWRKSPSRKPLILKGARQVGKTYLLQSWGKNAFAKVHYINLEKNCDAAKSFERDFDVSRIIRELSFTFGSNINTNTDLIIVDEIQECPRAITSLKYFCEDLPELAIACAGSLLGVKLSPEPFPVGKVDFLELHPMTFVEFLMAADTKNSLSYLPQAALDAHIPLAVHNHLWDMLKVYFVTGGMPEVIGSFLGLGDTGPFVSPEKLERARKIQRAIITSYESDIAKHAGKLNATHIQALFRNIPSQIAAVHNESIRRFQFGSVMSGKKGFAVWEGPIQWLKNAGLVHQIKIANKSNFPLEHFTKPNMFKLVPHDIGLLGCMLDLPPAVILQQGFGTAKGYFAEAYVAQCLVAMAPSDKEEQLYCWQEGEAEIEFVRNTGTALIPIEVKSGSRTKSRSLGEFVAKYHPPLAFRISAKPLSFDPNKKTLNLPLALTHWIRSFDEP